MSRLKEHSRPPSVPGLVEFRVCVGMLMFERKKIGEFCWIEEGGGLTLVGLGLARRILGCYSLGKESGKKRRDSFGFS